MYRLSLKGSSVSMFKQFRRNAVTEVTFDAKPFKFHLLKSGPESSVTLKKAEAIHIFSEMDVIRKMELVSDKMYKSKIIRGFCHLYSGQEACAVGMKQAMKPQDLAITAYRAHGWTYLMGASPLQLLAELTGRQKGCARGKGGSMHTYTDTFFGGNGIVGAQVPLGTGLALALKYQGKDAVSVTCYGDGAANQGQVFEAYNIACLWCLPVIYVCENNQYGMGTATSRSSCNTNFYQRGDVVPGIWVNGMDVISVICATQFARNYVLGCGPIILEFNTYRYSGHSMSDPGVSYRSREEIDEMRKSHDPITSFKKKITESGLVTEDEIKEVEKNNKKIVDEASKIATEDAEIPLDELAADVYSKNLEPKIRNVYEWNLTHRKINKGLNEDDSATGAKNEGEHLQNMENKPSKNQNKIQTADKKTVINGEKPTANKESQNDNNVKATKNSEKPKGNAGK